MQKNPNIKRPYRRWLLLTVIVFVAIGITLYSTYSSQRINSFGPAYKDQNKLPDQEISDPYKAKISTPISQEFNHEVAIDPDGPSSSSISPYLSSELAVNNQFHNIIINELGATNCPNERQYILEQALEWLQTLSTEVAGTILTDLLNLGINFEIGMPFRVGISGNLRTHPTLRAAALDWLGQLAPEMAKEYSRTIFDFSDSADEWALALRNYGKLTDPGADDYFSEQIRKHISNVSWLAEASGGFAEGFDALVYNQQYDLLPDLIELSESSQLHRLLVITVIDNLIQHDRETALPILIQHKDLFGELSPQRAMLLARADPRSPAQSEHIKHYLLDPNIPLEEKEAFAAHFPHFSGFLAHRLLTTDHIYPLQVQAEIDLEALRTIRLWQNDSRFIEFQEILSSMENRINNFVLSAYRGGLIQY